VLEVEGEDLIDEMDRVEIFFEFWEKFVLLTYPLVFFLFFFWDNLRKTGILRVFGGYAVGCD